MSDAEILFHEADGIGFVLLNRPKALNALTYDMCVDFDAKLVEWAANPAIKAVIIEGAGEKAFCSGGDVRKVYEGGPAEVKSAMKFFGDEYIMNSRLHHFSKPFVALLDGIVMGGGFGVSAHGSHRVVSERTLFAMPETAIGLIPDVGGGFALSRFPGKLGLYVALTGTRFRAADCLYMGFATDYVPSSRHEALKAALRAADIRSDADVDAVIARFAEDAGVAPVAEHRAEIDAAFSASTVEGIVATLALNTNDWAQKAHASILVQSPTSLKLTFRQLRDCLDLDFNEGVKLEYRVVARIMLGHDFYEGIRAVLVDRDNAPKWQPDHIAAVTDAEVDHYFASLGADELVI
ncbi:enoyl-CoA hydratase/isomerase family protein [Govanella unica]|uniref:3-hydroxyisobutyryl-CoA hydrolase n=1 Tax=Govanella unica TaxID=2975056 RepID=A0A9X3TYQ9_9PROT|nr:enoyl-CoA hydratase/isomerase family protein [Govania unica]MDA5194078.1 enoyl-CoA hydratase/isomerase family protein [Govania unica]